MCLNLICLSQVRVFHHVTAMTIMSERTANAPDRQYTRMIVVIPSCTQMGFGLTTKACLVNQPYITMTTSTITTHVLAV